MNSPVILCGFLPAWKRNSMKMNSKEFKVQDVYIENGYKNREDYLKNLAANFDIDLENVLMIADMLGPNEDFDGLVTSLEDFTG